MKECNETQKQQHEEEEKDDQEEGEDEEEDREGEEKEEKLTVQEVLDRIGYGKFQIILGFLSGLIWMMDGIEIMLLSFLLPALEREWLIGGGVAAAIASSTFAGMLLGSLFFGRMADVIGRRAVCMVSTGGMALFGLASAFAPDWPAMLVFRTLTGCFLGGAPISFAIFTEHLPSQRRGFVLVLFELSWTAGTLFQAGVAWATLPTLGWRWMLIFSALPIFMALPLLVFLPQSPHHLAAQGRLRQAKAELEEIAFQNAVHLPFNWILIGPLQNHESSSLLSTTTTTTTTTTTSLSSSSSSSIPIATDSTVLVPSSLPPPPLPSASLPLSSSPSSPSTAESHLLVSCICNCEKMKESMTRGWKIFWSKGEAGSIFLLLKGSLLRVTVLLWFLWFACSLVYYGVVLTTPQLLVQKGNPIFYLYDSSFYANIFITTAAEIPGVLIASYLIEKSGRKWSAALFFLLTGTFQLLFLVSKKQVGNWFFVSCGTIARASIMAAYSIVYTYTPEVYPSSVRGIGTGSCFASSKIASILSPIISTILTRPSPHIPVVIYGTAALLAAAASLLLPRETANRPLYDTLHDLKSLEPAEQPSQTHE